MCPPGSVSPADGGTTDLPTLRRELWAVLDLEPQTDRDLVETVRNLAAEMKRAWSIAGGGRCECGEVVTLARDGTLTEHYIESIVGDRYLCEWSGSRDHEPPALHVETDKPTVDRLTAQRDAVLAIADQLDNNLPGMFRSETANRLREALQSPTPAPTTPDRVGLEGPETPTAVCAKCGTAGCLEDAASGSYESDQEPS